MGRRPEPAGVKAAKAPVRSTKAKPVAAEAIVQESGLKAPAWLKGEGLAIWHKRAPMLRDMRMLGAADELAFARYCRNFAKWQQLRDGLDRRGYTYNAVTTNGGKLRRVDPAFMVADRLERQLLATEDRFGMNPAERQRIIAQRAAGAGQGALPFGSEGGRDNDPATPAAAAAAPVASPIGMLN